MLKEKIIIVTGGNGLLGKKFCKILEQNNAVVIPADINSQHYKLDITSEESILDLINKVSNKYEKIDGWVNCAYPRNKNYGRHIFDVKISDFNENVNMNLGGYFLCCQQIAKYFVNQGYGNIVNIASIYGVTAPRFEIYDNTEMTMPVEYAVIKSGLIHLTKYLAKYLKGKNIRVNSLSPGGILNNQAESFLEAYKTYCLNKGMLDADDMCGTLIYLLSDMSKFVNGQNIVIDDGFCL